MQCTLIKNIKEKGHLFKDRFKSKIVNNERYLKTLSLYMHNNPTDIVEYKNCPEKYVFSSLAIFLGKKRDFFNLVDYRFIMNLFGNGLKKARENYYNLVSRCNKEKFKQEVEFQDEKTEYKSVRKMFARNFKSEDIIEYIVSKMNISRIQLYTKYSRKLVQAKSLTVVLMRSFCNFNSSDISKTLGNITQARISLLSTIGIDLIGTDKKYENIIEEFIKSHA